MQWIMDEVDDLVASGVLTAESGAALRRHYGQRLARQETGGRVVLLSVLGAALIGAGVILLIAHNWEDLGRPVRTFLSLLPLLISGAISLFTLLRRAGSTAWRESAGVAQSAGVAASIALVSQTYHISGELSDFLFTWLILILPLPYLLRAVMPALVYLAGIAVWAGATFSLSFGNQGAPAYWLFLAAILPFYGLAVRADRLGRSTAWLSAFLGVSMTFGLGFTNLRGAWIPAFSGLFGVLYLAGALGFPERRYDPLRVMGALGTAVLSVWLSFKAPWSSFSAAWTGFPWPVYVLAVGFPCVSLALWTRGHFCKTDFNRFAAVFPLVVVVAYGVVLGAKTGETFGAICFTFYALALALGTAFRGLRQRATLTLNGGLLILAALIVSRFVDSDFSIVARGVAFVLLGCAMLGANLWILKAKQEGNA